MSNMNDSSQLRKKILYLTFVFKNTQHIIHYISKIDFLFKVNKTKISGFSQRENSFVPITIRRPYCLSLMQAWRSKIKRLYTFNGSGQRQVMLQWLETLLEAEARAVDCEQQHARRQFLFFVWPFMGHMNKLRIKSHHCPHCSGKQKKNKIK